MLTDEQRLGWERDGFLVLREFFTPEAIDQVNAVTDEMFRDPPDWLVVDNTLTGRRGSMNDFTAEERAGGHLRLNALFRRRQEVRAVALDPRLRAILRDLLGEPAVLFNSLTFAKGSQQTEHSDALYLTPRTPGRLVATWIALEDAHPDAGQLFYYPGSHILPRYTFRNGSHHFAPDEMGDWMNFINGQLTAAGLRRETFAAKKGDLFIWASDLIHGGSPINDVSRTRRSLVSHYFSHSDSTALGFECVPEGDDGYWQLRHPAPPAA
jgi:ectoine hydroxylase-related dioxygenase (phytanoyl-CoA dioxygenase family)